MSYKISIGTAMALCLSAIIGDTLFVVTGVPIAQAGSNSLIAFVIVGVLSLAIALQLGELGSIMPEVKGAGYSYVRRAFGSELGFITGVLLFTSYCAVVAAITFSFAGYFLDLVNINSGILQIAIAVILIILISTLNMRGVKETSALSKVLVVITLIAAAVFVVYALLHGLGGLSANLANTASQGTLSAFGQAVTTIVFAYAGFQTITTFTERIKGQGSGLAKTLILSIVISIIAYVAVAVGLIALVPSSISTVSSEPLLYALHYAHSSEPIILIVGIGTLIAIAASTIAILYTASRLLYQLGIDGLLPAITRAYNRENDVAVNGIWISAAVSILLLFSGNLYQIVSISNFGIIFSWIMACISVISLRRRASVGTFRAPFYPYLTLIGIASCIIFMLGLPQVSLALGITIILVLLVVYYSLVELRLKDVPRIRIFD